MVWILSTATAAVVLASATDAFTAPRPFPSAKYTQKRSSLSMKADVDVLVVGSGISGSTLAFHLFKNHNVDSVLLTERNPVVGGNVISKKDADGFVWEEGPNSFQPTPDIMKTAYEVGIADELVLADGSLPRFVYWAGDGAGEKLANLHALPTNLPGDLLDFNLLTWPGE